MTYIREIIPPIRKAPIKKLSKIKFPLYSSLTLLIREFNSAPFMLLNLINSSPISKQYSLVKLPFKGVLISINTI